MKCARIIPIHCASGDYCPEPAGYGQSGQFCESHAEQLGKVRDILAAELANTSRYYRDGRHGQQRPTKPSTCCNPYCGNPRDRTADFCDDCIEAGYAAEEVA